MHAFDHRSHGVKKTPPAFRDSLLEWNGDVYPLSKKMIESDHVLFAFRVSIYRKKNHLFAFFFGVGPGEYRRFVIGDPFFLSFKASSLQ